MYNYLDKNNIGNMIVENIYLYKESCIDHSRLVFSFLCTNLK